MKISWVLYHDWDALYALQKDMSGSTGVNNRSVVFLLVLEEEGPPHEASMLD